MQQRQKGHGHGHEHRKLTQVNLKVTSLCFIAHLPPEPWNRGASNHQDIQTKIRLEYIYACLRMELFLAESKCSLELPLTRIHGAN